jgi:hypothetical protein
MTFPCRLSVAALAASSFAFLAGASPAMADGAGNLLMQQINGLITPLHGTFNQGDPTTSLPVTAFQNVGVTDHKDNVRFNLSGGVNDSFSVGTETQISAGASASTTQDYSATVEAVLSIGGTSFNQFLGFTDSSSSSSQLNSTFVSTAETTAQERATQEVNSRFRQRTDAYGGGSSSNYWGYYWYGGSWQQVETDEIAKSLKEKVYNETFTETFNQTYNSLQATNRTSGIITGDFVRSPDMLENNVTIGGIGANNSIHSQDSSIFKASLAPTALVDTLPPSETASAQASASGGVSTNASASSVTSQFVSAFATAF